MDLLLLTTLENIRYVSGFTGSSGVILLTEQEAFFLTDSRYATQARDEVKGLRIRIYRKQTEETALLIRQFRARRIGVEAKGILFDTYTRLKGLLSGSRLMPAPEEIDTIRCRKDREEAALIQKAAHLSAIGFQAALRHLKPGAVERDIAFAVELAMKRNGADSIAFDVIVASGARSALPHGKASEKKIKSSELVVVDLGARYHGYHSDETCTFVIGKPKKEYQRIYQVVKDAHDKAIDAVRPGIKASSIDSAARDFIIHAGYGKYFGHSTGHGIGLAVHEWPSISQYNNAVVEEGMIFTIEPGIYIPDRGGVRIEDMVLVTKDGCKLLTEMSKELTIVS